LPGRLIREAPNLFANQPVRCLSSFAYCAFIQVSEPANLTDTSEMKMCRGLPSAVPRCVTAEFRGIFHYNMCGRSVARRKFFHTRSDDLGAGVPVSMEGEQKPI